jgi:AcrR family transcriptional regulator
MNPEQRREMIVRAALPLVAEHGSAVTTQQVARTAGIGEATIFRAFADKDALLDAVVLEVIGPDHVLREIASISLDQPLADRLVEAADALAAHLHRMGAVLGALHGSGHRARATPGATPAVDREAPFAATRDALAELFEPDRASLRMPAGRLAGVFMGLLLARGRTLAGDPGMSSRDVVELFLLGALGDGGDR